MIRTFYSTAKYEKSLNEKYRIEINKKQTEIDARQKKTNQIQKYTAKAYISRPDRIFYVKKNEIIYCGEISLDSLCPLEKVDGEEKYV